MPQTTVIENPILNSPYEMPGRHFRFDDQGRFGPEYAEVYGEARKDKAAKVATARNLWIPAVNNHGGFGRWAFVEIDDPLNCEVLPQRSIDGDDWTRQTENAC